MDSVFFWVFADACRLNVLLSLAFSLSPSLKSTHTQCPPLLNPVAALQFSGWCGAHMVLLSGDLAGCSSSCWLVILSGFSGCSAGGGPVCPSPPTPSFPRPPMRPHSFWIPAATITVSRGYWPGFRTSFSISDLTLLEELLSGPVADL